MCGTVVTVAGVSPRGGLTQQFDLARPSARYQAIVFYPADWEEEALQLLSSFSDLSKQFAASHCSLFGCSTDTVSAHTRHTTHTAALYCCLQLSSI